MNIDYSRIQSEELEQASNDQIFQQFETSIDGLSDSEAKQRFEQIGPNAIEEKKNSPILRFFKFFWGPIPWMIEAAIIISAIVQDWTDLGIISTLLIINALIGFWQEFKADNAIEALKQKLALQARVKRDSNWITIQGRELVPGDLVHIRLGNIIPGDLKLISGSPVEVDQSTLTGESLPIQKEIGSILFMSSILRRGEADGIIVGTGMNTFFGKTAKLVESAQNISHYQQAILKIGRYLIFITIGLVIALLIASFIRHETFLETLKFCLVLTIASIPVAMPAVLSVTMAIGAERLARQQAVVTKLVSIEEMAGMDLLCSDKTGTLTQNHMIMGEPVLFGQTTQEDLMIFASLASRIEDEDPIETPIFQKLPGGLESLSNWTKISFEPFDPTIKRTEATVKKDNIEFKVSKGAPQAILKLCEGDSTSQNQIQSVIEDLGKHGYRTLGVAKTNETGQWEYLGMLSFHDPPWDDAASTIKAAISMGIHIQMLTGDNIVIAKEIARQIGLGENIVVADKVIDSNGNVDEKGLAEADGFAQVFPEHKFNIVKALQKLGHFVGMTGDGVNDAPALKEANVGIAVAGATDAARSAADLVLTAPGLSVIIGAIQESRRIFHRMQGYSIYRIAETIRVLIFMSLSILILQYYPVTTVMIIFLALLNDIPIMMIAYDNATLPQNPTKWDMHKVLVMATFIGIIGIFASIILLGLGLYVFKLDTNILQTLVFLKLTVSGHMTIYHTRNVKEHAWIRPYPNAKLFWTAEITQIGGTFIAVYGLFMAPLGWALAGFIWGYAIIWFIFTNYIKVAFYRWRFGKNQ